MRECSYELYVAAYEAVRQGMASGDGDIVRRVSVQLAGRDAVTSLVTTLAVIEAKDGTPARRLEDVCDGVLCDRRCARWAARRASGDATHR